jgi:ferric-chelate reductase [NAD(P)H]
LDIQALNKINYGMYIVSTSFDGVSNGQVANTLFQATAQPVRVVTSINKLNYTHELLLKSRKFTASILSIDTPLIFIGRFGFKTGREVKKFEGINSITAANGCPVPTDYCAAYIEATVINTLDVGSHTLFIADVTEATVLSQAELLTYSDYHLIKGGKTPKNAATYAAPTKS